MGADQNFDYAAGIASTLDWWRGAGVDTLVEDEPRDWLAAIEPLPIAAAAAPSSNAVAAAPDEAMPDTIEAFLAWRIGATAPEAGWSGTSIAASGPVNAEIMIVIDCPHRDDRDGLLSGTEDRLFDRMLAAIGLSRENVHLAALCNRRPSTGRVAREIEGRLGAITLHHIGLVAPKRLLLMGDAASRAVLGASGIANDGILQTLNHRNGQTKVVASFLPRFLIERPTAKGQAWRDLQVLMGELR